MKEGEGVLFTHITSYGVVQQSVAASTRISSHCHQGIPLTFSQSDQSVTRAANLITAAVHSGY